MQWAASRPGGRDTLQEQSEYWMNNNVILGGIADLRDPWLLML